jgi:predicted nucleic acid-binding protein
MNVTLHLTPETSWRRRQPKAARPWRRSLWRRFVKGSQRTPRESIFRWTNGKPSSTNGCGATNQEIQRWMTAAKASIRTEFDAHAARYERPASGRAEPSHSQHEVAVSALRALPKRGYKPCIVPQVLYEFWVVVTRPIEQNGLGMRAVEAELELNRLGPPLFRLFRDERAIYDRWRQLVATVGALGKSAHDARLVAAMERHGLTHLLTFNTADFLRYAGITVIEPQSIAAR